MSTHNIGFYAEISKIINTSSNMHLLVLLNSLVSILNEVFRIGLRAIKDHK